MLHERNAGAAKAYAWGLCRSNADAEDLVAEAFTKVMEAVQRGNGPNDAFRPYLLTVIRRLAIDTSYRRRREEVAADAGEDASVELDDPAVVQFEREMVREAFATLPERWQKVLWYTEVEGRRPQEVGPLLDLTPNACAALTYRAREGLRQAYLAMHRHDTNDPGCGRTLDRLPAYVRGTSGSRGERSVAAHLDRCERCLAAYLELVEINSELSAALPLVLLAAGGVGAAVAGGGASLATAPSEPLHAAAHSSGAVSTAPAEGAAPAVKAVGRARRLLGRAGSIGPAPVAAGVIGTILVVAAIVAVGLVRQDEVSSAGPPTGRAGVASSPAAPVTPKGSAEPTPASGGPTGPTGPVAPDAVPAGEAPPGALDPAPAEGPRFAEPPSSPIGDEQASAPVIVPTVPPRPDTPAPPTTRPDGDPPPAPEPTPTPGSTVPPTSVPATTAPEGSPPSTPTPGEPLPPTTSVPPTTAPAPTTTLPVVVKVHRTVDAVAIGSLSAGDEGVVAVATKGLPASADAGSVLITPPTGSTFVAPFPDACTLKGDAVRCSLTNPIGAVVTHLLRVQVGPGAVDTLDLTLEYDGAAVFPEERDAEVGIALASSPLRPSYVGVGRLGLATTGASVLDCDLEDAGCGDARMRSGGSFRNNDWRLVAVDEDADAATFNSASATLNLPVGASVRYAALIFGGAGDPQGWGSAPAPSPADSNKVSFTNSGGGQHTVTAERYDVAGDADGLFQGFADVTSLLSGSGTYTVGNVQVGTGRDAYGGWSLMVVYEDAARPVGTASILHGLISAPGGGNTLGVPVGGFAPGGNAAVAFTAWEGDPGLDSDGVSIWGLPLQNALNPSSDVANSTIGSKPGTNGWGVDIDEFFLNGAAPDPADRALNLIGQSDVWWLGPVGIVTSDG